MPSKRVFFLVLLLLSFVVPVFAQGEDEDMPMADITNDEGGVQVIQGSVEYTVGFLTDFNRGDTSVVLIDNSLYVDRDFISPVPAAYQVIGEITSDVYVSPFTYQVNLPIMPRGEARDVDNDGEEDAGVVIMSVVGYTNFRGGPFWDTDYEYSTGFTSTQGSTDFEFRHDVVGGKMIIWAPDDEQGFPAGFGEDGFLFTEDDPIMRVPAGYSVVNLDDEPFTLDRSIVATVDLIEQEQSLQPADYTDLSYSEAFDALIEQMRNEYAFTELKGIDWDALYEEFAPRFAEAEENNDPVAYQFALRDFTWAIPDGHVGASLPLTNSAFFEETDGGLGIAIRELDDGRVIVNYLVEGGPAAEAGVELGAEIITINGQTVDERASEVNVWSAPFSLETSRRLQELRYVVRFPVGEQVELVFKNPGSDEEQTATLETIAERESWSFSSINNGAAPDGSLPIEFDILDSGYAYVRINTFSEYPVLMFRLWEWIIDQLNANNIPGL
ncbi:MAG: peptidase S41, partial [Phototrophicales bacterium]